MRCDDCMQFKARRYGRTALIVLANLATVMTMVPILLFLLRGYADFTVDAWNFFWS